MKIPKNIQEIFKKDGSVAFGTATLEGNPNINMIGLKKLQDDETIILADNYFNKTLEKKKKNNKGTILIIFKVEKIYNSIPGPNAGNLIEEK